MIEAAFAKQKPLFSLAIYYPLAYYIGEDKTIDPNQPPTPEDGKIAALGIRRYLLVTLKFQSAYPDAARFLSAVTQLPRPVEVQTIDMRRNAPTMADGRGVLEVPQATKLRLKSFKRVEDELFLVYRVKEERS